MVELIQLIGIQSAIIARDTNNYDLFCTSIIGIISNRYTVQIFVSRGLDSPSYTRDEYDNIILYIPHSDNSTIQYNLKTFLMVTKKI